VVLMMGLVFVVWACVAYRACLTGLFGFSSFVAWLKCEREFSSWCRCLLGR
jgi:hypothetical protein